MAEAFFALDTSNYTTSCALYYPSNDTFLSKRKILDVPSGSRGLRQSDTVFQHTRNIPELMESIFYSDASVVGVSYSSRPVDSDSSYMPCFTVGNAVAVSVALALNIEPQAFSHQAGHIAAAIYSSKSLNLYGNEFLAFHCSGGTTEIVLVKPNRETVFKFSTVCNSLDLKAGQAIDRVGVAMGLKFPAGKELEKLAVQSQKDFKPKPFVRNGCVSFSGLENKCIDMLSDGEPKCNVAKYCLAYVLESIKLMTYYAFKQYGSMPLIFTGGVMSDLLIREGLIKEFNPIFCSPELSSDNAVGTAYLGYLKKKLYQ